jgi:FAD/FMN-containing dehydrogenase
MTRSETVPPRSDRLVTGDLEYKAVLDRQFNKRFRARPEYVRVVTSTSDVVAALDEAVAHGKRVVATSGGHCLEGFVSDPEVQVIIDVSPMKRVHYDAQKRAVAIEAGATVGEAFRELSQHWGVVVPLGEYPGIGMGGHVAGGAFGFLCRELGLAADYLYAVEVVTVDEHGRARPVVATREESDPHRELWWAHTGGGAGNFGIVTRYWLRSVGAAGHEPSALLPRAPESVTTFKVEWSWDAFDAASFARLVRNHGTWAERSSAPNGPSASLWTLLQLHRKQLGKIITRGVTTAGEAAEKQIADYLAALTDGVSAPSQPDLQRLSWLDFALNPFPDLFTMPPGGVSTKMKDALLKARLDDRQIGVVFDYLTRADHDVMGGMFGLASYGGRINAVEPLATASAHRDCILTTACNTGWLDPRDEEKNLAWVRAFYRELFADTGGVPAPGVRAGGALINHPDSDLADATLNTSGVPWFELYYRASYPRLQRIKAKWDPRNVFRHALSIQPPDSRA